MKKGFTLQEVLITLAIVGIVAAITVPGIRANMPSRDRIQFLKAYNALTKVVEEVVESNQYDTNSDSCEQGILSCPLLKNNINSMAGKFVSIAGNMFNEDGVTWRFEDDNNRIKVTASTGENEVIMFIEEDGGITVGKGLQAILKGEGKTAKDFNRLVGNDIIKTDKHTKKINENFDKLFCMALGQRCNSSGGRDGRQGSKKTLFEP